MHPVTLPEPTQKNRRSGATHENVNSRGLKNKQKPLSEVNKAEATHSFKLSKKNTAHREEFSCSFHACHAVEREIDYSPAGEQEIPMQVKQCVQMAQVFAIQQYKHRRYQVRI
jgi:hypothetical protein